MRGEVLEWRGFAVLLAHEQHWDEWREDDGGCGEAQFVDRSERRQSIAEHAVADLVVVLREHHELLAVARLWRRTVFASAVRRVLAGVEIAGGQRSREIAGAAEADVVAIAFAGEERMQRVMKIVAPLRIEAEAEVVFRRDDAGGGELALRERVDAAAEDFCAFA